jgi:adenylate kinase family enzyme
MMGGRIHITGAAGSGTTTLGARLAARLSVEHFDTDDFYWEPSNPPYQKSRAAEDRLALLQPALAAADSWVLSGALEGWGDPLIPLFDRVIFLQVPTAIRLLRLRHREAQRFGEEAISKGGPMFARYQDFLVWAQSYDTAGMDQRSRDLHEDWLSRLPCEILRLSGVPPVDRLLSQILKAVGAADRTDS